MFVFKAKQQHPDAPLKNDMNAGRLPPLSRSVVGQRYREATSQSKPERFLKEQTATFASHTASIHLCAIRYLMLVHHKLEHQDADIGSIRSKILD